MQAMRDRCCKGAAVATGLPWIFNNAGQPRDIVSACEGDAGRLDTRPAGGIGAAICRQLLQVSLVVALRSSQRQPLRSRRKPSIP